ncbi:uncharacterized protein FFE2_08589 [Fusarium fujikuroi]|nr:uncharacterized protein FFE2_08589 [Fusarium fujikuroi]
MHRVHIEQPIAYFEDRGLSCAAGPYSRLNRQSLHVVDSFCCAATVGAKHTAGATTNRYTFSLHAHRVKVIIASQSQPTHRLGDSSHGLQKISGHPSADRSLRYVQR